MNKLLYAINYLWRLAATGAVFAFIFVGGGVFAMTFLRVFSLLFGRSRQRAQFCIHMAFRFVVFSCRRLGLIALEIHGKEKLTQCAGKLIIANHPSLLDVVILMSLVPKVQCIVKRQLWDHPFLGAMMREAEYIRNDLPPDDLIVKCKKSLDEGYSLIIFPEGTRTMPDEKMKFQRGFANIAIMAQVPIVPVVISCIPRTLMKGEPWWSIPPQRPNFVIQIEETLDVNSYILYSHNSLNSRGLVSSLQDFYNGKLINE